MRSFLRPRWATQVPLRQSRLSCPGNGTGFNLVLLRDVKDGFACCFNVGGLKDVLETSAWDTSATFAMGRTRRYSALQTRPSCVHHAISSTLRARCPAFCSSGLYVDGLRARRETVLSTELSFRQPPRWSNRRCNVTGIETHVLLFRSRSSVGAEVWQDFTEFSKKDRVLRRGRRLFSAGRHCRNC